MDGYDSMFCDRFWVFTPKKQFDRPIKPVNINVDSFITSKNVSGIEMELDPEPKDDADADPDDFHVDEGVELSNSVLSPTTSSPGEPLSLPSKALTVHQNTEWLKELKNNIHSEVLELCSAQVRDAVTVNKDINVGY